MSLKTNPQLPIAFWAVCLFALLGSSEAQADKRPYSQQELEKVATHIVVGKVQAIYSRKERQGFYEYTRLIAEVKVNRVEKGKGPKDLIYIRYFKVRWVGPGQVPPGGSSHHPQPNAHETYRFYLARNAYDGHNSKSPGDGGYNVVYVNGIQPITQ
ncbi:MAG: hypothetical protein VX438_12700 [Planctomycetota bacterium]|nr:hypothetical protein [Planctomycetota bacterium]